jgi:hypothetical protein
MMAETTFRSPGFFEQEIDLSAPAAPGVTGVPVGVVGTAEIGPAFVPVTVGNAGQLQQVFGVPRASDVGLQGASQYLQNGTALTFVRVLGPGANSTTTDISNTLSQGTVKNAGFIIKGSTPAGGSDTRHKGAVQYITAKHWVSSSADVGYPIFTDNNSFGVSTGDSFVHLVRGMVLLASGTRLQALDYNQSYTPANASDDNASIDPTASSNLYQKFKLVISSSSPGYATSEGKTCIRILTASLNPSDPAYIANVLNTDPSRFEIEEHVLYADFPVETEVAVVSTGAGSIAVLSGSANTSVTSGDSSQSFRDAFGRFDTRYSAAKTTYFISQPYGSSEYDLFYFETLHDGANSSQKFKASISTLAKSNDPANPYGTFTVQIRDFYDTDKSPVILEQFPNCTLNPDDDDYIARRIGDQKSFFNFDALSAAERKSYTAGTRKNVSSRVRVVMHPDVEQKRVPANALPFGFRGLPVIKSSDTMTDNPVPLAGFGTTTARRLAGVFSADSFTSHTGSIVPPVPMRFKVTANAVDPAGGFVGKPGNLELVDASYYWGIKSETVPSTGSISNAILRSNDSSTFNTILTSYSKLLGIQKLDVLVTGSAADAFSNNKFTLAKVALNNSLNGRTLVNSLNDITGTAEQHMLETAYIRNGTVNPTNYTVHPTGEGDRLTLASLYAVTSSIYFNKFTNYAKFTNIFTGGFDGLNMLDPDITKMNDRSTSSETGGKAVASVNIGLNSAYTPGAGTNNSIVTAYRTAAEILTNKYVSNVNVVAIPGIRDASVTNYVSSLVQNYGFAIYLMDIPGYDYNGTRIFSDATDRPDVQQTGNTFATRRLNNNFVAVYFPDVSMTDQGGTSRKIKAPASVAALAALGYNDAVAHPWYAPAGFNRGALNFVSSTAVRLNSNDRDFLYDNRINPITSFPGTGYVIFGQKTLQVGKSALDRVNVRRLVNEVKRVVSSISEKFLFEQNNAATRAALVSLINPALAQVQAQQGIEGFRVIIDETNNTQADVIANRLNGRVIIIPTRAIEFISVDFIVTDNGASFV